MKTILLTTFLSYLIGTVNPSYIIGKIRGIDIREKGSGNAGGSNALITFGKAVGILCILFDIAKAYLAVLLAMKLTGTDIGTAFAGTAVILGHMFPFYMGFRGGKGFACLGGFALASHPIVFLILLATALLIVLVTDYICFGPICVSVIFAVVFGILAKDWIPGLIIMVAAAAIFIRHTVNLKRIKEGTELHFSYLWNKDKEMERVSKKES